MRAVLQSLPHFLRLGLRPGEIEAGEEETPPVLVLVAADGVLV